MRIYHGKYAAAKRKFGIVVARFNEHITRPLLDGAVTTLRKAGVRDKNIEIVWVPGGLEVPQFCKKLRQKRFCDAVIAIACVIRGGTYHFEVVSHELTRGISQVALETGTPIATAVVTVDNLEQAIDRAGLKSGNKGEQAALVALEIASLNEQLGKDRPRKTKKN
ncbi:MAG TPA: 6,7-dimethyl-8-ribityllumazine synthase [Candidatus Omnitrophota bacterium]|jgi:6,7-dimethyl-8-ribityllumazine synthase|nr:6,7-dimethyl-8-ribityllumazine synthase [Candidatus Omnitrophota bacterium]